MKSYNKVLKQIFEIIFTLLLVVGWFYCCVYYRFVHPELTQIQLVIALWKEFVGLVILSLFLIKNFANKQ